MIVLLVVAAVLLLALAGLFVIGFNRLRQADVRSDEALGGIDVQLTRRADLIPNLVTTVKGYAQHERSVFEEVTKARTRVAEAAQSGSVAEKAAADEQLSKALVDVMAVAEAYPDLKASANFAQLQAELSETENKLSFARQYYNDAAARQNTLVKTIPWMFFAGVASVGTREFYEAPAGQDAPPAVEF